MNFFESLYHIVFVIAALIGAPILFIGTIIVIVFLGPGIWEKIKLGTAWLFDFDIGLGSNTDYADFERNNRNNGKNTNTVTYNYRRNQPHMHNWVFLNRSKHGWSVNLQGKPMGRNNEINDVIQKLQEMPGHSETTVDMVLTWKSQGAEIVHTSWNHWRCNLCGETKQTEYYCAPTKKDGDTLFKIDLNEYDNTNRFKKMTTQITTFSSNKREVAVEQLKKYS